MKHLKRTAACCSITLIYKSEKQKGKEAASAQYTPTTHLQQTATI